MMWDHCAERPDEWSIDYDSGLAQGLVFFGGGRHPKSKYFHDSSLFGNHGTLTNIAVPADAWVWVPKLNRLSLYEKRSVDENQSVIVPHSPSLDVESWTQFSLACWVIPWIPWVDYTAILMKGDYADASFGILTRYIDQTYGLIRCFHRGVYSTTTLGLLWSTGVLIHLAYTWADGSLSVYVNGQFNETESKTGTSSHTKPLGLISEGDSAYSADIQIADPLIYNRVLSAAEIAALADPSNVMLSGLVVPPRRRVFAAVTGGGAEVLIVGGAESLVTSESPALTQHQVLVVSGAESLVESDSPAIVQHYGALTVGGSESLVESESPALVQHHSLVVGGAEFIVASESPALTQHHVLAVGGAKSIVASQNVTLDAGAVFKAAWYVTLRRLRK